MSSPIVERVREIPLVVERDYPMECDDTGFPFDDDREDGNAAFRSQLDDIAARHPEFAHHLGSFPFRAGTRSRQHIPEEFTQRFTESPFPDRFERFGFPFEEPTSGEEDKPYYQRYPHYYPQDSKENKEQASFSKEGEEKEEPTEQEESGRGRKLRNIQQSNTVDLGQRQEPVNDRNQRSMSAPPPNKGQRFVSSINIPVNQPAESSNMPQNTHQHSAPPQPQERVIPIHVEGRDEPILPKKASTSTSQPQAHPQPPTDKFFTQKSPNFSQYFNRDPNFQSNWFPKTFQGKQQPPPQQQASFNQNQRGRSPQPQPKPETTMPHPTPEPAETQQPKQMSTRPDPIDQIKSIQKDVSQLMGEVEKFDGKPKDKKYLYLDEMLTRNLIKLDNIDTQGQENIRSARKEAIKCIEKCISILESKANSNVENKVEEKPSEVVESKEAVEEPTQEKDKKTTEDSSDISESKNAVNDEKMEVDTDEAKKCETPIEQPTERKEEEATSVTENMDTSESTIEATLENKEEGKTQDEPKTASSETGNKT